jgi:hypothetical protein
VAPPRAEAATVDTQFPTPKRVPNPLAVAWARAALASVVTVPKLPAAVAVDTAHSTEPTSKCAMAGVEIPFRNKNKAWAGGLYLRPFLFLPYSPECVE